MKAIKPAKFERIILNTIVQEKVTAYPTDSRLLEMVGAKLPQLPNAEPLV